MNAENSTIERPRLFETNKLIVVLPGFGDPKSFEPYASWEYDLAVDGANVAVVDMYDDMPGATKRIGKNKYGEVYYSDMAPYDYYTAISNIIDIYRPTRTVLCGVAFGANQAIQNAFALHHRGYDIAGVVAISPTNFFDQPAPYRGLIETWDSFPGVSYDPVELHDTTPARHRGNNEQRRLSCLRFSDLLKPGDSEVRTLHFKLTSVGAYIDPFGPSLFGVSAPDGRSAGRGFPVPAIAELLKSREYTMPTAFIGGGGDWRVPKEMVRGFAEATTHAAVDFTELPDVWHDFRASQPQTELVTETVQDKVEQFFTAGTVTRPAARNDMTPTGVGSTSVLGVPTIPRGAEAEAHILIPDDVVHAAANYFGLQRDMSVLDPMCGYATIPRVLGKMGMRCTGVELDESRYLIAREAIGESARLLRGDFRKAPLQERSFDAIFTGVPWDWFRNQKTVEKIEPDIFPRLHRLLKPSGQLLIDSTYRVERDGQTMPVSTQQAAFMARHCFRLTGVLEIRYTGPTYESDTSLILQFRKA